MYNTVKLEGTICCGNCTNSSYLNDVDLKKRGWGVCDNNKEGHENEYLCPKCTYEGFGT